MLGYLTWAHVAGSDVSLDAVTGLLDGVELPAMPLPIDVFRRITGSQATNRYTVGDEDVILSAVKVKSPDGMAVRDLVMTVSDSKGVAKSITRVGTAVFYKPPPNEHGKARLRLEKHAVEQGYDDVVAAYVEGLRHKYETGVAGQLDNQAVRRLVRRHLANKKALYLGGPYFTLELEAVTPLRPLFDLLGPESVLHSVPMPNRTEDRLLLTGGIERAMGKGHLVDERIWLRLEETPREGQQRD